MKTKYTDVQYRTIAAAVLLMFAFALISSSVGYFVASVTEELHCSRSAFLFYFTVVNIATIAAMPLSGKLLTMLPCKRILLVDAVAGGLILSAFATVSNVFTLYLLGGLLGLIKDIGTMLMVVHLINHTFDKNTGTPTGIAMAGTGICGIVLGFVMPGIIGRAGFRTGYLVLGVTWFVCLIIAMLLITEPGRAQEEEYDYTDIARSLPGFTFAEVLKDPLFYGFMISICLLTMSGLFLHHMPVFFVDRGLSPGLSGRIISAYSAGLIIFKMLHGYLYDRLGAERSLILILAIEAAGFMLVSHPALPVLYLSVLFLSFGMASLTVFPPLLTMTIFGKREYTRIYSAVSMAFSMGNAIGSTVWGVPYDLTGSYGPGLSAAVVILIALIVLFIAIIQLERRKLMGTNMARAGAKRNDKTDIQRITTV